jgi:hypothetical protein
MIVSIAGDAGKLDLLERRIGGIKIDIAILIPLIGPNPFRTSSRRHDEDSQLDVLRSAYDYKRGISHSSLTEDCLSPARQDEVDQSHGAFKHMLLPFMIVYSYI